MKRYQIIGCSREDGEYDDRTQLHETDRYDEAKGWLAGYVRFDGLKQSGYAYIMITEFETKALALKSPDLLAWSMFDQSGWTHY